MSVQLYAIRQISTGYYLPHGLRGRANTCAEPSDKKPPRLFSSIVGAKNALRWYLEGQAYGHLTGPPDNESYEIRTVKVPTRKSEDMHVVKVYIST